MLKPTGIANVLSPDWELPPEIAAAVTCNSEGAVAEPFGAFNLAIHVGDDTNAVARNRLALQQGLQLPCQPLWLTQVHGVQVVDAELAEQNAEADASISRRKGLASAVLTADCLPVLFYSLENGGVVAAAHAGWRGLLAGVLEATVNAMAVSPSSIHGWLGPAIGPDRFEVGAEVKQAFMRAQADAELAFKAVDENHYLADIYALARQRLTAAGVQHISGGGLCTVSDSRFYSYRRAGLDIHGAALPTGRMASLIWIR